MLELDRVAKGRVGEEELQNWTKCRDEVRSEIVTAQCRSSKHIIIQNSATGSDATRRKNVLKNEGFSVAWVTLSLVDDLLSEVSISG